MTILQKFTQRRTAYLPLGLAMISVATAALVLREGGRRLLEDLPQDIVFAYGLASGAALAASLLWQWRLYFARQSRNGRRLQREYRQHRWFGLVPMALLVGHMGQPGATLLSVMICLLLLSSVTGLFNNEVIRQKSSLARRVWLIVHVGTAGFILPLVLLHIWAVLAFRVQ